MTTLATSPAPAAVGERQNLNLGEWAVTGDAGAVLQCLGLGSCVALCAHDATAGVGGMAHMVLPNSTSTTRSTGPKFVDIAVPTVIEEMERQGAVRRRIACYLVGGSHILTNTTTEVAQVGERNVEAARAALQAMGIRVRDEDIGGERGRTVRLQVASGLIEVAFAGEEARLLAGGRT